MLTFLKKLFGDKEEGKKSKHQPPAKGKSQNSKTSDRKSVRKGELGEFKINIQLDQLPKEYRYLSDVMMENPKSRTGYSQIDHVVITPYGLIIIETKNYVGVIKGKKKDKHWNVNNKFKMMNPFFQNYGHLEAVKKAIDINKEKKLMSMVSFTRRCTFKIDLELRDIKSDQLIVYDTELSEFVHRKMNVERLLQEVPLYTEEEIQQIYSQLQHANIEDPALRKKHVDVMKKGKEDSAKQDSNTQGTCCVCQKPVSQKVKSYCLANAKRFEGNIYCYDHQKQAAKVNHK
ncbi:NERD domain-containing protein [Salibacterium salarium]|uniref:NERD domain-containing protein n=1 Tax=Salibacterium salarium TaxID=284579 RepID=A0A428MV44_9BACI|nr:nuclease-related domain-containing protein [Salibacterium salarium]RSL29999.1 NERD domain-containing protein [Salibacterium salarium]